MMTPWHIGKHLIVLSAVLVFALQTAVANEPGDKTLYSIDFSQQPDGSAIDWLKKNSFILELDAEKLNPRFENQHLVISTDKELAGIIGIQINDDRTTLVDICNDRKFRDFDRGKGLINKY